MGCGSSQEALIPYDKNPIGHGKIRIGVAGTTICDYAGRARTLANELAAKFPDKYETWFYFDSSNHFYSFLKLKFDSVPFPPHLKGHSSSPFVWLEQGPTFEITPIGGCDRFREWVLKDATLSADAKIHELAATSPKWSEAFHNGKDAIPATADVTPPPPPPPQTHAESK